MLSKSQKLRVIIIINKMMQKLLLSRRGARKAAGVFVLPRRCFGLLTNYETTQPPKEGSVPEY
jgi:hypothetical protein